MAPQKAWQFNYHTINISGVWRCSSTTGPEVTADGLTGEAGQRVEDWTATPARCGGMTRVWREIERSGGDEVQRLWPLCSIWTNDGWPTGPCVNCLHPRGGGGEFDTPVIIMGDSVTVRDFALWDERKHSLNLTVISKIHFSSLCLQAESELPGKERTWCSRDWIEFFKKPVK